MVRRNMSTEVAMKAASSLCVAILLLAVFAGADEPAKPEWLVGYLKRCETQRERELQDARDRLKPAAEKLKAAKRGRINRSQSQPVAEHKLARGIGYTYASTEAKESFVRECSQAVLSFESTIKNCSDKTAPYFAEMEARSPSKGDVGILHRQSAKVFQVIDDRNVLVQYNAGDDGFIPGNTTSAEAFRIQSKRARDEAWRPVFLWISGLSTDGMSDCAQVSLTGVFRVDGSETYETETGTNTVPRLVPVPPEMLLGEQ